MYALGVETFLAVVRTQSLSGAAEKLHVAQTTISQRLKVLEHEMGLMLVERGKGIKTIRLTPSGEEFLKLADQWELILQEAKLLQAQGPKLSLVVGSVNSINSFILPPVFRMLNKYTVPIKLKIRSSHSLDLYHEIENRQVEIAFVLRDIVHPNVTVTKCFSSPMVVLRLADPNRQNKPFVHPRDLDPNYELFMPWGFEYQTWHDHWWNPLSPPGIILDSANLLFDLLQDKEQWAIVPKIVAAAAAQHGNYSIEFLANPPPKYTFYKLTHKNPNSLTRKVLTIFDYYFQQIFPVNG